MAGRMLEATRTLAEAIVQTVRQPLLVLDAELRIELANPAFYQKFQVSEGETLGRLLYVLGNGQWDLPRLRQLLEEILPESSQFNDFELEHEFPAIGHRAMLLNGRRLIDQDGHTELILLAIEDITERRALEELQRGFIALIVHELRNPVAAIIGYAQLLERLQAYDERAVKIILTQGEQVNRLVTDLLEGSNLDPERLHLQRAPVDLAEAVQAATEQAGLASPSHQFVLHLPEQSLEGSWDAGRLNQVLANLLSNAIKYSAAGSQIDVTVQDLGPMARVSVEDQGAGIPRKALPRLFDRFYRAPDTASEVQGLGLGLHVTKLLVEAHGGTITVASVPGQGSTFGFTLPYS